MRTIIVIIAIMSPFGSSYLSVPRCYKSWRQQRHQYWRHPNYGVATVYPFPHPGWNGCWVTIMMIPIRTRRNGAWSRQHQSPQRQLRANHRNWLPNATVIRTKRLPPPPQQQRRRMVPHPSLRVARNQRHHRTFTTRFVRTRILSLMNCHYYRHHHPTSSHHCYPIFHQPVATTRWMKTLGNYCLIGLVRRPIKPRRSFFIKPSKHRRRRRLITVTVQTGIRTASAKIIITIAVGVCARCPPWKITTMIISRICWKEVPD